jgi:hypothetical protein
VSRLPLDCGTGGTRSPSCVSGIVDPAQDRCGILPDRRLGLARASGVNRVVGADIAAGRKGGSVRSLKALAAALGVAIDDLVCAHDVLDLANSPHYQVSLSEVYARFDKRARKHSPILEGNSQRLLQHLSRDEYGRVSNLLVQYGIMLNCPRIQAEPELKAGAKHPIEVDRLKIG